VDCIAAHRASFGIEPICEVLAVAPPLTYAAKKRPPRARKLKNAELKVNVERVWSGNRHIYGARKVWQVLNRRHHSRCPTERLMRQMTQAGQARAESTAPPAAVRHRPTTWSIATSLPVPEPALGRRHHLRARVVGFAYAALVTDVFSRRNLGCGVSPTLRSDVALYAFEMAVGHGPATRISPGSFTTVRAVSLNWVGSRGDSYYCVNALAESLNGLYKSELICNSTRAHEGRSKAWSSPRWAGCTGGNHERLLEPISCVPPAEFEAVRREEVETGRSVPL
jgi:putative transposase